MPSIQVKIVGDFCNLRCSYCRDRDFDQGTKVVMSELILQKLIDSLLSLPQALIRMHWLGGEPTLAGLEFFQKVIQFQEKTQRRWLNTIQTNATLIDWNWAQFFHSQHFKVGVSIDGTTETHNLERVNLAGHGTYIRAMEGVNILRKSGISPSVICVITKRNVQLGAQIFRGLVEAGFTNIAFNAFYNTATDPSCDPYAVSDSAWTQFLKDIFEEWITLDRPDVRVREIDDMLAWTQGRTGLSCVFRGTCSNWVLVDFDGKVYPCERLGRSVYFGDINSVASFTEILKASPYQIFTHQTTLRIPDKCGSCIMQSFCHNGCVAHRINDGDIAPHYAYCGSRLAFHAYLIQRIGEINGMVSSITFVPGIPDSHAVSGL